MAHFSFSVFIFGLVAAALTVVSNGKNVPRFFIFGDSLVDAGNNNYIKTIAKGNNMPNGCDFVPSSHKPTGRYCNGKTVADLLVDGFDAACYPPPYLGPGAVDAATMCGINYASGGAGILNKTGYVFIGRINMDAQIDYFADTKQAILKKLGPQKTQELIETAFFPVIMGSNDMLDNFLLPLIGSDKYISPEDFVEQLISRLSIQLTMLYNLGARRFLIVNVGPVGCIPYQIIINKVSGDNCAEESNSVVRLFNSRLQDLTFAQLSPKLHGADFYYADVYNALDNILANYVRYGFEVKDKACCKLEGVGKLLEAVIPCGKKSTYCSDRSKYVFWDSFHPSEASNKLIAGMLMDGGPEFMIPNNIRHSMKVYGF